MTVAPPKRRLFPRLRWRVPLVAVAIWLTLGIAGQRHLLFPGQHMEAPSIQAQLPEGGEKFWVELDEGRVECWYLPALGASAAEPAPLLVVAHGNAEFIDHWLPLVGGFTTHGLAVLLVEYPGYGRSEGSPSEASVTAAMVAAYDQAVARADVDGDRVVGFGRSLGGGAVCALARQRTVAALVLSSAFTTVRDFSRRYFLPGIVVRDPFDNEAVLASYAGPVLLFHGRDDDVVPYEQAERLAAAAQDATFISWSCRHNDCPPNWDEFCETVHDWLAARGLAPALPSR